MKKRIFYAITSLLAVIVLIVTSPPIISMRIPKDIEFEYNDTFSIVRDMKIGWNLGNSLEAGTLSREGEQIKTLETQTAWGNPLTTQAMIDAVKAKGFKTVRIPITWNNHFGGAPEYTIDGEWLTRVREVVDYAYNSGLYVIINMHHDDYSWLIPNLDNEKNVTDIFTKLWKQIGVEFMNYGEKLLFESINEPRVVGSLFEWAGGTRNDREVVNRLNKAFVETIRAMGGNNSERFLIIPTYAASKDYVALKGIEIPNDERIIVAIHSYFPRDFATDRNMKKTNFGNDSDINDVEELFASIYHLIVSKGTPVIMDEFGAIFKQNDSDRAAFAKCFVETAAKYSITCCWWDNGAVTGEETKDLYGLFDRNTLSWAHEAVADALISAAR